jgi:uncharacterized protein (TIGR03083 family)
MASDTTEPFQALQASIVRLRNIVEGLSEDQLRLPAYPTEWTVADVLSHLGSGGEIMRLRIEASVSGHELPDDFAPPIWETWNAKSPGAKAADALAVDRAFVERIESLTADERDSVHLAFGPVELDLGGALGARLNEHVVHSWDVDVTLEQSAVIPVDAAAVMVDNLGLIAGFSGRAIGSTGKRVHVRTSEPVRDFALTLGPDAVALIPCSDAHAPDLELPAEALIRLVYGRLDPDHTPAALAGVDLSELRGVFRGV